MDTTRGVYRYTSHGGKKQEVPIELVCSLSQLQRGDHIAVPRSLHVCMYWHHGIVEDIDTQNGEISVIEYSNTTKGFLGSNSLAKTSGKAKVQKGKYALENVVYLIKHKECLDAETVVSRARNRLEENKYHLVTNNCEHFAMSCKTGIESKRLGLKRM